MVRLKVAVAATAGALAGGLAVPSAASADTVQVVYNVGLVESQTPPPGTVVAPGGNATIRVYVPPPAGCF